MTDEELLDIYEVRDRETLRQGSEIMAMALAEIGYKTEPEGPHLRVLNGPIPDDDLLRAQNIGRRMLGIPEFPDMETARQFWRLARTIEVA